MAEPDLVGARVERVLDSASELLVRWGYQRVTIDEVARHAGIGKGTVYLHFRTKEALFLTVLLRAQEGVARRIVDRLESHPANVMPSRVVASVFTDLAADPVLRALYLADVELLGRLAHEAGATLGELAGRRDAVMNEHLRLLRDAGCLRDDLPLHALRHTFDAIGAGFFFVDGFGRELNRPVLPDEERARLLERALALAVEVPDPPAGELARLAPVIRGLYASLLDHTDHEWRRRVR
jgi:AcrR family transcriptional regulator